MNTKSIMIAAACGALLTAAAPASAALITNGGFETGSLSGWTASGNVGAFAVPYFGVSDTTYGRYVAAFNGGDSTANGVLSQTIATAAGTAYNVSFNYAVTSGGNQSLLASIIDTASQTVLATRTASSTSSTPGTFGFSFTAVSGSTVVRFSDLATNTTNSQDGALDNVSVSAAVPEPATWGLMLLGFGAMGYTMRRRTATSARIRFA